MCREKRAVAPSFLSATVLHAFYFDKSIMRQKAGSFPMIYKLDIAKALEKAMGRLRKKQLNSLNLALY